MISLRGPKLKIIAALIAAFCLAAGIYTTFFQSRGFVKTTATIVDIEWDYSSADSSDTFTPTVEYTVNGKTYTGKLNQSSGSYKVGKTIPVLYDPNDPTVVHGGDGIGIYFIVVGALILAFIIFSAVKEKQDRNRIKELRERSGQTGYAPSVQGEEREVYFLTDLGTPKYGHRIEDQYRRVLYEAKMTKFNLASAYEFDFIDHEHGTTAPHLVGHEEESQWDTFLIDNHYTFELDGVDVWKHLKENGVSVDTALDSGNGRLIGTNYRILRDGLEIARAESTSQYPHEEDAEQHKAAGAVPVQGFYRVWTREQNLDLVFMTLVAFARSGAADDRGGNYGVVIGTLKTRNK
ncbi:MAG: DUF3592 domain-containing protein [Oscillospiraceae bacterium]|nr:DUF3592 domain-containing protein [Oscillospiraceae bacterium]